MNPIKWWQRVVNVPTALDSNWLRANPLPLPADNTDKNARGQVLVIGGSTFVPGGLMLTAEAALRAGAGKVQIASVSSIVLGIGLAMPEVATIALGETSDGDIDVVQFAKLESSLTSCDVVVLGPAMGSSDAAAGVTERLLSYVDNEDCNPVLILDAAALLSLPKHRAFVKQCAAPVILTPHMGELAALLETKIADVEKDPGGMVRKAAKQYSATVMLKGSTSLIVQQDGVVFAYAGGGVGLATGGSGDVLAGLAAGLAARGAQPHEALLWAVWLHGEAGRRCAEQIGPLGYLARELLAKIPAIMRAV